MTISNETIKTCARRMVYTCNLKNGDGVVVSGGSHTLRLLEDIAFECLVKGATPTIVVTSDRYSKMVYDRIPAKTLETTPKQYVGLVKAADVIIRVEELEDPRIAERFPREKLKARQKAMLPVIDILDHPTDGKKWLYAGWPTEGAAKSFGVDYRTLRDIVIGGISVNPRSLMQTGTKLARKFRGGDWVHVWDDKGTDFRVRITGRRLNVDDAFTSDKDFEAGDRGANLPAGELFIAPHETEGEGTLYSPVTRDRLSGRIVKEVHLEFKKGKLQMDKVTAGKNLDALIASFNECEQVDSKKYSPVRTKNLAELGIGFNPKIRKAIGYILTDEKVYGTIHLAFGSNSSYGGVSESTMHWDFVSAPGINIDVEYPDGKTIPAMRRGKFV